MEPVVSVYRPRELLVRARAIVLDFDGTLVDSNPIKYRAFERCFADTGPQRDAVLAYCLGHHHVPRGEKFRYVYERILQQPYTPEIARRLHRQFEAETTEAIIHASVRPGADEFLAGLDRSRVVALLSSTPHEILLRILEGRGWQHYFHQVRGAPVDKAMWLLRFREQQHLAGSDVVVFGDADEDGVSARAAGCRFV